MNDTSLYNQFKNNILFNFTIIFFSLLTGWWLSSYFKFNLSNGGVSVNIFTLVYPFMALVGGVSGLHFSKKWGGFKSTLGKAIGFFSLGLLAQFAGQAVYAYYIYVLGVEIPYPSLGDIGYFGSVIFYIIASYYLARVGGLHSSVRTSLGKVVVVLVPSFILLISYLFFLKDYQFDWSSTLTIFLDFAYPFGQAVYVSIALFALLLSNSILSGSMRSPVFFLIIALITQYFADFMFLYQAHFGNWVVGGINDYLYLASYFLMTIALLNIGKAFTLIKGSN